MLERIKLYLPTANQDTDRFFEEVVHTLSQPQKTISAKYSYGGGGTQLWFQMLEDPNYYLYNCDTEILTNQWKEIIQTFGTDKFNLIDLGAGDGRKTQILINGALSLGMKPTYIGVDISDESNDILEKQMEKYRGKIDVKILTSTYQQAAKWISQKVEGVNVYLLIGGTIGSFSFKEIQESFKAITEYMKEGQFFFLGQDLVKDPNITLKAYSQPNYLTKGSPQSIINIHDILGGNLGPDCFYPHLFYDPIDTTIKDYMISKYDQILKIRDKQFYLKKDQPILVFSSRKSTIKNLQNLMIPYGLELAAHFEDKQKYFTNAIFKMNLQKKKK